MKYLLKYIGLILLFNMGCQQAPRSEVSAIEEEISKLKSVKRKKAYLENLFKEDQKLRQGQDAEIVARYGKNSPEHVKFVLNVAKQDSINFIKVEQYLEKYGYPKIKEVGDLAAQAPWVIIHHCGNYEKTEKNFEYLYGAYLNGDIDEGAISLYLGRMYEFQNGSRYPMESPFKAEEEINQLIEVLELTARKKKIEESN